ncbi:MAG: putative glycosyltransferase [Frankiales bacterium]|nr:putative glycosyltransferase [Frankiales bacterium]
MRILHVCQPTDGGAAVVVRDLVRAGVSAGDEVTVACPGGEYLANWTADAGARWVEVPMSRAPTPRDVVLCLKLRALLREHEVAHLHSSKAGALGRLAVTTLRTRRPGVLFTPHGWSWYVGGRAAVVYRRFERWAARFTTVVTVVSNEELRAGRAVLGPRPRIELVENGVDTDAFRPDGPAAPRTAAPLLVQVGRLSVQKGQDRSVEALARLGDPSVRLRLVGEGPDRDALLAQAAELGVAEQVEFVGSVDPRPHLRAADVVLLPSRWEGMSLVLLEAMSCGTAIIAADCGGSDALAGVGVLVPHEDDESAIRGIAAAVVRLLGDPAERDRLGAAARAKAIKRHSLGGVVKHYEALWREVMVRSGGFAGST